MRESIFLIWRPAGEAGSRPSIVGYAKSEQGAKQICTNHNQNPYNYHWWYTRLKEYSGCDYCEKRQFCNDRED